MKTVTNASIEERNDFAQKIYGIVGLQVLVTAIMCFFAINSKTFLAILCQPAILVLSLIGIVVISIMFCCSKEMRSTVPRNYILLLLFTLCEGSSVATICGFADPEAVALAGVLTGGVFLVLTGYAITTKEDYTIAWRIILTLAIASLFLGIVRIFYNTDMMELLACFIGIITSCFYILYDTQLIFGGHQRQFELDDYILAALNIYLDLVILFVKILKFISEAKGKKKKENE